MIANRIILMNKSLWFDEVACVEGNFKKNSEFVSEIQTLLEGGLAEELPNETQ
jgi:hypothetical protein